LPAIGFLLLFLCFYFTIKSIEKEAQNPVFTGGSVLFGDVEKYPLFDKKMWTFSTVNP
jgi:uncharacterized membrane protein